MYWAQDGDFQGTSGTDAAASLLVNSTGTYTYTLIDNMLLGQGTQGEQINLLDTVTITAQDADGDNVDVDVYLKVQDDKPSCEVSSDTVTVEDEHAPGGINEWWDGGVGHVTGTIVDNVNWGADGFGSATTFSVAGQTGTFAAGATVYWSQTGAFQGTTGTNAAASLLVNSTGTYTYNLIDNLLLGQNTQGEQINNLATVSIIGQDKDGDLQAVSVNLQVQDDTPLCITLPDIMMVEDEKMPGGNDEFDFGVGHVDGTIVNNTLWGADGFGLATKVAGINIAENGNTTVYWAQNGAFMGAATSAPTGAAASLQVFSNGTYTYTLMDNVLLGLNVQGEQINHLDTVTITAQDADGDTVAVGLNLLVQDDKPGTMVAEANTIVEDEHLHPTTDEPTDATPDHTDQVSGDVSNNGNWGADGFGAVTQIQVGSNTSVLVPSDGSVTVYFAQDGDYLGTSNTGAAANLLVNSDGTYTFTVTDNLLIESGQGELIDTLGTVKFTGVDADGDKATVNLTLQVQDDVPTIDVSSAVTYTLDVTNYGETSAGYDNSFGYYIKDADGNPTTGVVVWDNVKSFENGTVQITGYTQDQVGFFIIPNGNNTNPGLAAGTEVTFVLDTSGNWQAVAGTTPLFGQGANVLFDVAALNSDNYDHVEDNAKPGNLNWEDLSGGGDNDYNDINIGVVWSSNLPVLTTQDAETIDSDGPVSDTDSDSFANLFTLTSDMGADDGGTAPALSYSLSVNDTDTDLTSNGLAITLAKVGNDIVGSTSAGSIFSISVDAVTGVVTLTQYAEIDHLPEDVDGVNDNANIGLPDGLISLTATATIIDGDGDTASDSQTLDISGSFNFDDDVPTVDVNAAVMVDDDDVVGAGGNAGGLGDDVPVNFAGTLAHAFGADGAGSIGFASMVGQHSTVGTETVDYSWDSATNTLTATVDGGARDNTPLFKVVTNPATGEYAVTQMDNVLHTPPVVTEQVTINTGNYTSIANVVEITVDGPGKDSLNINDGAFGITSNDGGDGGRYDEINYLGQGNSEVMKFELQNDIGEAKAGMIATHATVNITEFYTGSESERGSYTLYSNGVQVQGPTSFSAVDSSGAKTLDISYAAGFDEIRFVALRDSSSSGGDNSDYNVKSITFDLRPEAYENNAGPVALTYTVTDGDGDSVNGTLNLTFDDDTPVAYNNEVTFNVNDNEYTDHITINTGNTNETTGIGADGMVKITVNAPGDHNGHATLIDNGGAFGITSDVDGNVSPGYSDEINYLGNSKSEVMRFELQNDHGEAADGKIATHATVDINVFYANEDMNGSSSGVADEVGSYSLWNNGHQVQGATTFTATSEGGTFQLSINGPEGGFDEIRFSALRGDPSSNDPSGGDSSDYNVKQVTFDLVSENETGNLLTGSDPDGSFGADSGHVLSIAGVGTGNIDSIPDSAGVLTVEGKYGGMLTVESDGDYIYTPPAGNYGSGEDVHEKFSYTLIDGDGDTSTAQLDMLIDDPDHHDC